MVPVVRRATPKLMLMVFFDSQGLIHHEYAAGGGRAQLTAVDYREILMNLVNALEIKWPGLFGRRHAWGLLQDNAPIHAAHVIQDYLWQEFIQTVPHAPNSPDLNPCNFWMFGSLKQQLAGAEFDSLDDLRAVVDAYLAEISTHSYHQAIQVQLPRCRKRCVANEGAYFEH